MFPSPYVRLPHRHMEPSREERKYVRYDNSLVRRLLKAKKRLSSPYTEKKKRS